MADKPKIAFVDIETTPSLGWVWGMWEQNVMEVEQDWFMLSFAVKWNDGVTKVYALPDYKGYSKDKTNDKKLSQDLWDVFNSADIVAGHNIDGFDIKKANARFLVHGLLPYAPIKTIDTLKIARRHFKFDSNRLDDLARYLGVGRKLPTQGKKTWLGCMSGDKDSWATMKKYNKQDVELLYSVHDKLQPWAANYPNLAVYVGEDGICPHCLADKLQKRGPGYTKTGVHQRFQCTACGAWSRGNNEIKVEIR